VSLGCSQRVGLKEGNDTPNNIVELADPKDQQVLGVVVIPQVPLNLPATEPVTEQLKGFQRGSRLSHCKFGLNLEVQFHLWVRIDGDRKADFAIDESSDPVVKVIHGLSC
jgi:hypothetical protein